ncbi:MAG: hypothetical protein AABY53_03260 [Bdellovibrionota bacterium]
MNKKILFILFLIISLVSLLVPDLRADEASAYAEIARLRKYAGGSDESDLKVQLKLNQSPSLKKKQNAPEEPSEGF